MPRRSSRTRSGRRMPGFGLMAAAIGIAVYVLLAQRVSWSPYQTWLVTWSITAFAFYGWDKAQSQRGGWRVPEMVLHALALVGGVAGCWAGVFLFRHKTRHTDFLLVLIFATIIHGAIAKTLLLP